MKQITKKDIAKQKNITFEELRVALNEFCKEYPQFKDKVVVVASECGFGSTTLNYPACFCVTEFYSGIKILSTDDGQFKKDTQFYQ